MFQLAPVDGLTMTLDYLLSRYEIDAHRGEQSMWLQQTNFSDVTFDTGNAVATPTYIRDVVGTKDFGLEQQRFMQKYKLDDIGFNTEWAVNDSLTLTPRFDGSNTSKIMFITWSEHEIEENGYFVGNASVELDVGDRWSLTAGVTNLFDEEYLIQGNASLATLGYAERIYARPRSWYLQVAAEF